MMFALQNALDRELNSSSRKLKVTLLSSEWWSRKGGISTLNRVLAIQLAKHPLIEVTVFVNQCSEEEEREATSHNINVVRAARQPGFPENLWLCFPPNQLQIDIVIGHGAVLGAPANKIKENRQCKWVQVVHTAPKELGMFKTYSDPNLKGETKHQVEVELCEMADFVVGVGPKLCDAFQSYLRGCKKIPDDVINLTPGIFSEYSDVKQASQDGAKCRVLTFGRGDEEDFELKGYDIAAKAVAKLDDTILIFAGALDLENVIARFQACGIPREKLEVNGFLQDEQSLRKLFCKADLVLMPSRTEGFGFTALEALSAGLPVLVSHNSGFGEALSNIPFGSSCVIKSQDASVWAEAIKEVWKKGSEKRLKEYEILRAEYGKQYCWENQCNELVKKMLKMTHGEQKQPATSQEENLSQPRTTDSDSEVEKERNAGAHDDYTPVKDTIEHQIREEQKTFNEERGTTSITKGKFLQARTYHDEQREEWGGERLSSQDTNQKTRGKGKPPRLLNEGRNLNIPSEERLKYLEPEMVEDQNRCESSDQEKQTAMSGSATQEALTPNIECENYVHTLKPVDIKEKGVNVDEQLGEEQLTNNTKRETLEQNQVACSEIERRMEDERPFEQLPLSIQAPTFDKVGHDLKIARGESFFDDVRKKVECPLCEEQFSGIKEPKMLNCLHTFCKSCLERWLQKNGGGALSCPNCRKITKCPNNNVDDLKSNLFHKQLVDIVKTHSKHGEGDSPDCNISLPFNENCTSNTRSLNAFTGHHVKETGNFKSSDSQLEKKNSENEWEMVAIKTNVPCLRNEKESLKKDRLRNNSSIEQGTEDNNIRGTRDGCHKESCELDEVSGKSQVPLTVTGTAIKRSPVAKERTKRQRQSPGFQSKAVKEEMSTEKGGKKENRTQLPAITEKRNSVQTTSYYKGYLYQSKAKKEIPKENTKRKEENCTQLPAITEKRDSEQTTSYNKGYLYQSKAKKEMSKSNTKRKKEYSTQLPDIDRGKNVQTIDKDDKGNEDNGTQLPDHQHLVHNHSKCSSCHHPVKTFVGTLQCGHHLCEDCTRIYLEKGKICPVCKHDCSFIGNQLTGHMTYSTYTENCLPGHEDCGTIIVHFNFKGGIQGQEQPNPGFRYRCLYCTAYLPDNPEGQELCQLLIKAFNEQLLFTIEKKNTIISNGIELKTSPFGGPANCGYPDPGYLDRLKSQLAEKGITEMFSDVPLSID